MHFFYVREYSALNLTLCHILPVTVGLSGYVSEFQSDEKSRSLNLISVWRFQIAGRQKPHPIAPLQIKKENNDVINKSPEELKSITPNWLGQNRLKSI